MSFLELHNVSKDYGAQSALESLDLAVEAGELVAIVGPSGAGKSTALRLIAGLETPTQGAISLDGEDLAGVDPPDRGVAMVFQSFALFPHMTVAKNIGFGLEARGEPRAVVDERVGEVASSLGIAKLLVRRPEELSGGERQRVALARGLVRRPHVLLMDEPLSNLDAQLRARTRAEIKHLHRESQITVVYVTHDQAEALSLGDRVAVLDRGRLQQLGSPDDVYRRPANVFVAGFIGSPPMNLLEATVDGDRLRSGEVLLPLPDGGSERPGKTVIAGFRAEDAGVGSGAGDGFGAILDLDETVGHDRVWWVDAEGERLAVRPPPGLAASEGDRVTVAVPAESIRLFDPGTGDAL